ncbi:MAG: fimbria/pilus periplasmic chaperone [Hyphomicrobiaceae bacterium]|nr:fimbria/pilus periplasmic chaperone [Hyphomicrobiaceae bacterium]
MRNSWTSRLAAGMIMALVAGPANPALAMSVSPTHIEIKSAGSSSRAQVVVRNDASEPLPVEATLKRFALDENGRQKATDGTAQFLVFPPQAIIPPGGTQVFRLTWVGEPLLASSESYLLSLSQIPVKLPKATNHVQVVMAFGVVINVAPPRGSPTLKVVGTDIETGKNGQRHPVIVVENPTVVHALLPQSTIRLTGGSWSQTLPPARLGQILGIGLVQPGKRRRFLLPITLPADVPSIRATLEYHPAKK